MSEQSKKFVIKEATRTRCKILPFDESNKRRFMAVSLEFFPYLKEANKIDFSLFFRAGNELIEFIKPNELSHELLEQMWSATLKPNADVEVCVLKSEFPKFEHVIDMVRTQKIKHVLEKDPTLDHKVLDVYSALSSASQMIIRGGINSHVANRAASAAAFIMSTQMDSEVAVGTISRMINCDSTLYDHSASVAIFSSIIALQFLKKPLSPKECEVVAQCGLYHDAGKSCVPNHVLNKPGTFTPEEFTIMKTHTVHGHRELMTAITKGAPIDPLAARVAHEHHERFTGKGYPFGKRGRLEEHPEGIHLYTRIVSIADVYSALLMKRVYKEAMSSQDAINIMAKVANEDFDPDIFRPFYEHVQKSIARFKRRELEAEAGSVRMIDDRASFTKALQDTQKEKALKKGA